MKIFFKIILGTAILYLMVFMVVLYEQDYQRLIRYLYINLSGNKLSFKQPGKYFHFASGTFVSATGLFLIVLFMLLKNRSRKNQIINLVSVLLVFPLSIVAACFLDAFGKVAQCTACKGGNRVLTFDAINYDLIYIAGLTLSLLPMIIATVIKSRSAGKN